MNSTRHHRRKDDHMNFTGYIRELFIGRLLAVPMRVVSISISIGLVMLGWGPLLRADTRAQQNPVFRGVFELASPTAWGLAFWVCASLMLAAGITGRAILFLAGETLSLAIMMGWASGVISEAVRSDEAVLDVGAIGYYWFTFTLLVAAAFAMQPLHIEAEVYEKLDDGKIVRMHSIERRAG